MLIGPLIESSQKKTLFYTEEGDFSTIYTLKALERRLPDSFIRIHRSFIVNISHIKDISRDMASNLIISLKSSDDSSLTVSHSYIQSVRRILGF
ncbi:LytR/AlgR family response regulator transcription factor [Guptibacillus hwajinpoensis]|uniref:LytR/AlgR family response regulator transcription factor n=1 Tax=Guptibacillus hwajinpoensis TaxID=208199 RepID=UPI003D6BE8C0